MNNRGKFIVLEGLDGCGKSTQTKMLIEQLEKEGQRCKFIHFPILEQGVYGRLIAQFLRGELNTQENVIDSAYNVHPKLVALMYACERKEHAYIIEEWLNDGYMVIADRYVCSNIAYQCAKTTSWVEKEHLREWILELEFTVNKLPRPDKMLFLDLPREYIANKMLNERTGTDRDYLNGEKDIHEADYTFQSRVYDEYMKLVDFIDGFVAVKCYDESGICSIEEIHKLIYKEVLDEKI